MLRLALLIHVLQLSNHPLKKGTLNILFTSLFFVHCYFVVRYSLFVIPLVFVIPCSLFLAPQRLKSFEKVNGTTNPA